MTTQKTWTEMSEAEREAFKQTDAYLDSTNPARVPWGEWSDAAVGAVFRAHQRCALVQFFHTNGVWMAHPPRWADYIAYRIPPEPKRETGRIVGYYRRCGWIFSDAEVGEDTHAISIPTIDGKPVTEKCPHCGTAPIDMEELG